MNILVALHFYLDIVAYSIFFSILLGYRTPSKHRKYQMLEEDLSWEKKEKQENDDEHLLRMMMLWFQPKVRSPRRFRKYEGLLRVSKALSSPDNLKSMYRIDDEESFTYLLGLVEPHLKSADRNLIDPITPKEKLGIFLEWLSQSSTVASLSFNYGRSNSAIHAVQRELLNTFASHITPTNMYNPRVRTVEEAAKSVLRVRYN
jgi:hypothetical protein